MAAASKMVRQYLDVIEELVKDFKYEVQIRQPRGTRDVRFSIGRTGEEWSRGSGSTLAVAMKRALEEMLRDVERDEDLAHVAPEQFDAIMHLLAGVV